MLTKTEVELRFAKILEKENNSSCFQCGKESRKWVETRHAIFLCGVCKSIFSKERVVNLKTINEDIWMSEEIEKIEVGGNNRFEEYINEYNLKNLGPQVYLYSEACKFYRIYLMNHLRVDLSSRPSIDEGSVIPVSETSENHEILEEAKVAFSKAGETAQYYGNAAYEAISHKIPISEIKEDALKAVDALGETAKSIWDFVSHKVGK